MAGTKTALFSRKTPGGIYSIEDQALTTGDRWFVDSVAGASTNSGTSPDDALNTVDAAIAKCTANKGDIIFVMPKHAETFSTAAQEGFDLDVAGVSIIGLGQGDQRPTFTFGHASASCVIGASSCRISNLRFVSNISDHVTAIDIEAAANGSQVDKCYFTDSGTTLDALTFIKIVADADRLRIIDNHFNNVTGGEATDTLLFAGGSDGTVIARNLATIDAKTGGFIKAAGAASLGLIVIDNVVVNQDASAGLCYLGHASSTGLIARNMFAGNKANTEPISEVTAMHVIENYMTDTAGASGIVSATVTAWT